jgi:selenoprotein W-related protein
LADHLVKKFKQNIAELALLPSDGGRFEIKVNDELIYSKLSSGRFPDNTDIESAVRQRM